MMIRLSALALALALAAPALAQDGEAAPPPDAPAVEQPAQDPAPAPQEDAEPMPAPVQEGPAPAMTLADARINLPTVVHAFVEKRSREGVWPLRDKASGRLRKLRLLGLDAEKTKRAGEEGLFAAPGTLLDVETDERVPVVFTVDFSGTEWKVSRLRFVKKKAGRKGNRSP